MPGQAAKSALSPLPVPATINVQYYKVFPGSFAKTVAGDDARVISLLTSVGPHDHKLDSGDVYLVRPADLFLLNGLTLDDFLVKLVNSSGNPNKNLVHKIAEA